MKKKKTETLFLDLRGGGENPAGYCPDCVAVQCNLEVIQPLDALV